MIIALNIRKLRSLLNWTQSELAEKANLSLRGIQAIETQGRAPRAETLSQIAEALGVSVAELYADPNTQSAPAPSSSDELSLIVAIQRDLPTLNQDQLRTVLKLVTGYSGSSGVMNKKDVGG